MPSSVALSLTLFVGAVLGGIYFIDEVRRWKAVGARVAELEESMYDALALQETHTDTLQEHDQRIREKKDYDSTEDVEEDKYQAWHGIYHDMFRKVEVTIWRDKCSTIQKNQEWIAWDKNPNASTVVRDFYLGNAKPDFEWDVVEGDHFFSGTVSETLVNGWDSIIKIQITSMMPSKDSLLEFTKQEFYNGSPTWNLTLKKAIDEDLLEWSRILIDA